MDRVIIPMKIIRLFVRNCRGFLRRGYYSKEAQLLNEARDQSQFTLKYSKQNIVHIQLKNLKPGNPIGGLTYWLRPHDGKYKYSKADVPKIHR